MYIKERNGKFRYFQDYKDPLTEKRKTVSCTLNSKSRAAQKQARIILTKRIEKALEKSALSPVQRNIKFDEAVNEWVRFKKNSVKPSTYSFLKCFPHQIEKYIDGNALLKNITTEYLEKIINDIQYNSGMKVSTVKVTYSRLKMMFRWAKQQGYINADPMKDIEITWKKDNRSARIEDKFLESDELKLILNYAWKKNKSCAAIIEWLYLTGMRFGEAVALRFDDITQKDGIYTAQVTGTLYYTLGNVNERYKSKSPKTAQSFRSVELPERAIEILNFEKQRPHKTEFIFETSRGTPYHINSVNNFLHRTEELLGLKKHLTTHIFRHTHISKLAELGVPLYVIKKRVGHSSNVTEKIYLHVTQKAQQKLVNKLDEL